VTTASTTPKRVTVVSPLARIDVALPAQCTVAELIPQLVRLAGAAPQPGGDSPGWGLARVGEAPLAPGLTVSAADLTDGELLHLSPRARYETPLLFDDVVDAIASAAENRRGAWRPRVGRRLAIAVAATMLLGALLLMVDALSGRPVLAVAAGGAALALLLAGGALSRARGDADAGVTCAATGTVAALAAGLAVLPPHTVFAAGASQVAVGLGLTTVYCALVATIVVHRLAWFAAAAVAAGCGALIVAVALLGGARPWAVAAVAVSVATALTAAAPMISLRLARLPLPQVPADMESFRGDDRPALGSDVLDRTSAAAEILTGLVAALGAVVVGCSFVLLGPANVWCLTLAGLAGTAWILRSRSYAGATQRVVQVVAGLAVLAGLTWRLTTTVPAPWLLAVACVLAGAAAVCFWYAERVVGNRHSPSRARWLDILEYAILIALVPVAGAAIGLYDTVRDAVS